jgi:DNA (cytosine-5)-methyltransferase 1
MTVTAVSLFAGVGGFDLGLEKNNFKVIATVEIDKNARGVLEKRFPETTALGDVCDVTGAQLQQLGFESNGIIVGGFPCQDLSVAGKRLGLAGERSGLFWEIHRILAETKAKWFILENVPGLLSSNGGRDLGTVLGALGELGYGVAYRVLDAQYFGIPQRRRRIFIVGCLGDDGRAPAEILAIAEGRAGYLDSRKQKREDAPAATTTSAGDDYAGSFELWDFPDKSISPCLSKSRAHDTLTYSKARRAQNPDDYETWEEGRVAPTLNQFENTGDARATVIISNKATVRRITPIECERLQGFPDNWTEGQTDSQRYKQMGNAVAVPVVDWIAKRIMDYITREGK